MQTLDGVNSGIYKVSTETSSYVINFNKKIAKRIPGDGLGVDPSNTGAVSLTSLRKDNEWFKFIEVSATVGSIMHIVCMAIADSDYTWRRSTIVRKIEKVDGRKKV